SESSSVQPGSRSATVADPIAAERAMPVPPHRLLDLSASQLLRVREGAQLLQALILDLPDPLARDLERPPDLVERPRLLAVEPVAQLEHPALPLRERPEDFRHRLPPQDVLGQLVRERRQLVGDEVPDLGLLVVADRLLERDGSLSAPANLVDLLDRQIQLVGDLDRAG